ncbi:MAG: molybdate ABC transporter substrate-binding protein, partial [Actinomycetota bacterium]
MLRRRHIAAGLVLTVAVASGLPGCARRGGGATAQDPNPSSAVTGRGTVFAAASLTEALERIGGAFEAAYPGSEIVFNFGSSSSLATQIVEGNGIADVFASADGTTMGKVEAAGLVEGSPATFARNRLQIVVGAGNPLDIAGLADLARPGLKVVLAAPQVPVGRYGAEALAKAGVEVEPVSLEADVKAVLTKVALGEADAGIVYATDLEAAGSTVEGVEIPDAHNVVATYPIASIRNAGNPALATAFVEYVLSEEGRRVLLDHGFLG